MSDFLPCWPHSPADHILCHLTYILPHQSHHSGVLSPQNLSLTPTPARCFTLFSHSRIPVLVFL